MRTRLATRAWRSVVARRAPRLGNEPPPTETAAEQREAAAAVRSPPAPARPPATPRSQKLPPRFASPTPGEAKIFSHFLSRKSLESVVTFSHHHMLNRRPSRIEVKPEDRQEEVQTKKKRRSVTSFVRSSFSFKLLLSLSVVSALVSVLNLLLTFKLIPFSLSKQYDDSRRAHVERLKQQIALQGPSPSGLDDGDDDVRGFVNAHHPLLQRPTTDARIGFIPPPHPPSHQ